MRRKIIGIGSFIMLLLVCSMGTVFATATRESEIGTSLWNRAATIATASEKYLPGIRSISYQEHDGKGAVVYSDQAVALLEGINHGRYIQIRQFGDEKIFSLIEQYSDGIILTPFNENLYNLSYVDTNVTELVNGNTTAVYSFTMAYDKNLPFYDPNYQASGSILGWDEESNDFDNSIQGMVWIERLTGAPVKLFTSMTIDGGLTIEQTVYFTLSNGIVTPHQIITKGSLRTVKSGGYIEKSDFTIQEQQGSFWINEKFARGKEVY